MDILIYLLIYNQIYHISIFAWIDFRLIDLGQVSMIPFIQVLGFVASLEALNHRSGFLATMNLDVFQDIKSFPRNVATPKIVTIPNRGDAKWPPHGWCIPDGLWPPSPQLLALSVWQKCAATRVLCKKKQRWIESSKKSHWMILDS